MEFDALPAKALSETEYEYMKIIWKHPEGIASEELFEYFPQAESSKRNVVFKISVKGYIKLERRGRHMMYFPKCTKQEYDREQLRKKMKKAFGFDSFDRFVAAFCGKDCLTPEETDRLKKMVDDFQE